MSLPVPNGRHGRRLHTARVERLLHTPEVDALALDVPEVDSDPALAAAWRECQMHWLATVPGYREEIRQRVSKAAREAEARTRLIESRDKAYRRDVDNLGREVEGCG